MTYDAPIAERLFVLETTAEIDELTRLPGYAGIDRDLIPTILEESGRIAARVFAPVNNVGDQTGLSWSPQGVGHPSGFAEAYATYVQGGWQALSADPAYGGQGMPLALSTACGEQLASASMAFSLCMILSASAVEALSAYGNEEIKRQYLPKLISGEWTGTMNLTEPQAGSDVGALATMATPSGDGTWRIRGSKIFITWGEHELAADIIHLVLARTPGSPAGTRGISLFVVPKFLPDFEGRPNRKIRNDLKCVSIEHKLGIHASPTCTMSFGDEGKCIGWLVGEVNGGMRAMFAMMNQARLNVGLEGVAIAERAYQGALGIQVFGGMGFIEETGAAQHWRDSRIAPIYEGTNGIQALDLVGRKLKLDHGVHWRRLLDDMTAFAEAPAPGDLSTLRCQLRQPIALLREATTRMVEASAIEAASVATPYLRMFGIVLAAYLLSQQAASAETRLAAGASDADFLLAKIATARFFSEEILPHAVAAYSPVMRGNLDMLFALSEAQLCA